MARNHPLRFRATGNPFPSAIRRRSKGSPSHGVRPVSELITAGVLLGIAGVAYWGYVRRGTVFVIRLQAGQAVATRGRVTPAMLAEIAKLSREGDVLNGLIRGVERSDGRIALRFSRSFPLGTQQQLRNWWTCHGWSLKPRSCCR